MVGGGLKVVGVICLSVATARNPACASNVRSLSLLEICKPSSVICFNLILNLNVC